MKQQEVKKQPQGKKRFLPIPGGFSLLAFLAKNWQLLAIVVLIGGIIAYHQFRTHTINSLREDLQECRTEREELAQLIKKQNTRIEELVKRGRIEAAKFEALKARIESSQQNLNTRIDAILNEPKPQTCEGAIEYLIRAKEELAWPE